MTNMGYDRWLNNVFLFSAEIWAEQLQKTTLWYKYGALFVEPQACVNFWFLLQFKFENCTNEIDEGLI